VWIFRIGTGIPKYSQFSKSQDVKLWKMLRRSCKMLLMPKRQHQYRLGSTSKKFCDYISPELEQVLFNSGIYAPNDIQNEALSIAKSGRDVLIRAQTGSGKTLAFLLPLLQSISDAQQPFRSMPSTRESAGGKGRTHAKLQPEALVVVPTRELAMQTTMVAARLAAGMVFSPTIARLQTHKIQFSEVAPMEISPFNANDNRSSLLVCTPEDLESSLEQASVCLVTMVDTQQ
jgi:hypothetical protein